jgi:hypothetical protein
VWRYTLAAFVTDTNNGSSIVSKASTITELMKHSRHYRKLNNKQLIKHTVLSFCLCFFVQKGISQDKLTFTDSLVHDFNKVWDENNLEGMLVMLQKDAFFKSPYQLRYSKDTMARTVLLTNPPRYKNTRTRELFSHIENDMAWSIGKLEVNIFDEHGNNTGKELRSDYIYVFTKKKDNIWRIQMLILHEKE